MSLVDRLPVSWQRWEVGDREEKELHYEEERRLFYVAITRAMETLTLFAPEKSQSPFIKNISDQLVKKENIMLESKEVSQYEELIGNYQSRIQSEINLGHFDTANYLLNAIENISILKKGDEPDWGKNPYKDEILQLLSHNESQESDSNPNLSATSIQTYNQCPLKYKYRYIDGIPGAPEKPYFQLGKVIHKVLEIFHEENYSSYEDLIALLDSNWQEGGYKYEQEKEQNRQDAEAMLKNYLDYIQDDKLRNALVGSGIRVYADSGPDEGSGRQYVIKDGSVTGWEEENGKYVINKDAFYSKDKDPTEKDDSSKKDILTLQPKMDETMKRYVKWMNK